MPNETASLIEAYLLAAKGWVGGDELCAAFNVTKRDLRARDERPGLCGEFAISSHKGFRHIDHATDAEFEGSCERRRRHAMNELRSVKLQRHRRANRRRVVVFEDGGNQALLLS